MQKLQWAAGEGRDVLDKKLVALDVIPFWPSSECSQLAAARRIRQVSGAGAPVIGAPDRAMAQPLSDSSAGGLLSRSAVMFRRANVRRSHSVETRCASPVWDDEASLALNWHCERWAFAVALPSDSVGDGITHVKLLP